MLARQMKYIFDTVEKKESGCWEWIGYINPSGYGQAYDHRKDKSCRAHRLSYELFKGEIPPGLLICHSCDNKKCVNPDHLSIGTPAKNTRDMVERGLSVRGRLRFRVHSVEKAKKCFDLWKSGIGIERIAKDLNLSYVTVYYLVKKFGKYSEFNFKSHEVLSNKQRPRFTSISKEKCEEVISLRKKGKTYLEIKNITGVKKTSAMYICKHPERLL